LHLRSHRGEETISSRPSDAIALAARLGAPIFAEESLLDEVGQEQEEVEPGEEGDEDELLEDFRDFIENVKPEDFGAG
jgi:bifunctional DNase/RNase